jgi:Cdc6-like AAA superfamily ATPase
LGSVDTQIGGELGGSLWLLDGTVSREVTRTLEHGDAYTATEDLRQAARDAMNVIAGHDQVPVLVCDDADRLLRTTAGSDQGRTLFEGFFGDVVRDLAEHLECGLIVAAQDSYREQEGYGDMIAGLLEELPVPPVDRSEQVGQIISARVAFVDQRATVDDLVTPDGVERLLELHRAEHARSLRRTLTVLRAALSLAAGEGAERVERRHIDSAEV